MPKTLADFQQLVARRIQDTAGKLPADALDDCVREAITGRYSKARPLRKSADFAGNGATYEWTLNTTNFPGWVDGFSAIAGLEYPANERIPQMLDGGEWQVVRTSSTAEKLRLLNLTPVTGKTLRVFYSAPHLEDGTTVPDVDFYGVCALASSLACQTLQAVYAQLGDSTLGADAVDYRGKAQEYAALSRTFETRFQEIFGLAADEPQPPASATAEWRDPLEDGGRRLIR